MFNEVPISATGGEGTGSLGDGGSGGNIALSSAAFLISYGEVSVNGGNGDDTAGPGGTIDLISITTDGALGKVLNTANLSANGGTASRITNGAGGIGGEVFIRASKIVSNQGVLTTNGGDGPLEGGDAGIVGIDAFSQTMNSGNLSANGGQADTSLAGSNGGDGGLITVATQGQPTDNSAPSLSVVKGDGSASSTAVHGQIFIDGSDVTPPGGAIIQP